MPKVADALLMYDPTSWGEVRRFANLYSQTHRLDSRQQGALSGIEGHYAKAGRLQRLAGRLRPNLAHDHAELEAEGYTLAENGAELSTILEAAFLEIYSTLDCMVKVLRAIYGKRVGGSKGSTRTTFDPARVGGSGLPVEVADALASATWYWRLLHLRDELTHGSTGSVHLEEAADRVFYMHAGVRESGHTLIVEDVFDWLDSLMASTNRLLGVVFRHLNTTLNDKPVFQICGMVEGRVLYRWVRPEQALDFHGGECGAYVWFERPDNPMCPFRDGCGAAANKAPSERFGTGGGPGLETAP